ncbi:hypothetical protein [Methyloraptor flagellatus]|uniref:Uncharacterized protein n=1 Tax=Methyloraptor flagellatus TaxID=3162530 RepID=A0AAU7XFS6_9HYPH
MTRFSVAPEPFSNRTVPPAPTENPPQVMIAVGEDWVMTVLAAEGVAIAAVPETTLPAVGMTAGAVVGSAWPIAATGNAMKPSAVPDSRTSARCRTTPCFEPFRSARPSIHTPPIHAT